MTGETDLDIMLSTMSPKVMDGEYVFCTFSDARYGDHQELEPIASISEQEGLTLIVSKRKADQAGLSYESVFKKITLTIHSSLDAVGLTAAFSAKLTEHGISANVVAGYYHDHIFVHCNDAEKALQALGEFKNKPIDGAH